MALIPKILNVDPETRFSVQDILNHPWMKSCPPSPPNTFSRSILEPKLNEQVVAKCRNFGIDAQELEQDLGNMRHNTNTTCYYLMLKYVYILFRGVLILDDDEYIYSSIVIFKPYM